jgi:hypothetical protein
MSECLAFTWYRAEVSRHASVAVKFKNERQPERVGE